jgi:transposase
MVNPMNVSLETAVKKLTSRQRRAIPLLATGMSGKDVASAINCNPATVSQWINHDEQFREALDAFSEGSLYLAQVQLESLALDVTEQLRRLLENAKSEQVRLKAIELILSAVGLNRGVIKGAGRGQKTIDDLNVTDSARYDFNKLLEAVGAE